MLTKLNKEYVAWMHRCPKARDAFVIIFGVYFVLGARLASAQVKPDSNRDLIPLSHLVRWTDGSPVHAPASATRISIPDLAGIASFQVREQLAGGQLGLPSVEYRILDRNHFDSQWLTWVTGFSKLYEKRHEIPVPAADKSETCVCPDGRRYYIGAKYKSKLNYLSRYTVVALRWFESLDRPGEGHCRAQFAKEQIVAKSQDSGYYSLSYDLSRETYYEYDYTSQDALEYSLNNFKLAVNSKLKSLLDEIGLNKKQGEQFIGTLNSEDLDSELREKLRLYDVCWSDRSTAPVVPLSDLPIDQRYSLIKEERDGQSYVIGVDQLPESVASVPEGRNIDLSTTKVDLNKTTVGNMTSAQSVIYSQYAIDDIVVVRKDATYNRIKRSGDVSKDSELVPFQSYARIEGVLPEGLKTLLFKIEGKNSGMRFLKWALAAPTAGLGTLIMDSAGAGKAKIKAVEALIQAADVIPAMDFLDLVEKGQAKAPTIPQDHTDGRGTK